ncbi:ribonuclease domain-containing protein [Rhodoferax fermentans]|uniref:Guanine-specific ribonuclease N1 and T1 n=1 Tax=Rhodoferax fermentans TaxID=28066 RepID=A0A1T1ASG8_RHOFE|nr:guanine-specific ribonuclease N1 and T1 [Rhodoferax fermentans]OOV06928.1 guanine-specific ribonuclease N1 and T1 [Rhodoferax fermentans]
MLRFEKFKLVITGLCLIAMLTPGAIQAKTNAPTNIQATIRVTELPKQGEQMLALIHQGGPFASEKDGSVFGNRERLLPPFKRGYYREYTVATPGVSHRGARRIVCGGPPKIPDICYYTADHYASFRKIVP